MVLTGANRSTRRETCRSATLSNTNPTWTGLELNPGLRVEKPTANSLSHAAAPINVSETTNFKQGLDSNGGRILG
jgi:hypothetical protein